MLIRTRQTVPSVRFRTSAQRSTAELQVDSASVQAIPVEPPGLWNFLTERLGPKELTRRIWHMAPGLMPLLWWVIPHEHPIPSFWLWVLTMDAVLLAAAGCYWAQTFSRSAQDRCIASSVGYAAVVLGSLLLFPDHPEFAVTVFAVLAFGDGSATFGGLLIRGTPLPWNPNKTWAGCACFLLAAVPIASLYYWGEARPRGSLAMALMMGGGAAVAGMLAESIPSQINDNIRVGLAALGAVVLMHFSLLGWK